MGGTSDDKNYSSLPEPPTSAVDPQHSSEPVVQSLPSVRGRALAAARSGRAKTRREEARANMVF